MAAKRQTHQKDSATASDRRENALNRRAGTDRRKKEVAVNEERRASGERRKVERRINEYRLRPEVLEFINAVNEFKSVQQKPFPTWSEIFQILMDLGYKRE